MRRIIAVKKLLITLAGFSCLMVSTAFADGDLKAKAKSQETVSSGSVLVMGLRALGASAEDAKTLTGRIAEGLSSRPGLKVMTKDDLKDVMAKPIKTVACLI